MSFSTGRVLAIGHGTTGLATVATLTNDTNYTIEWCTQRSLGSGSATKARINGGSFVEQTGSTTDLIDRWRPGSAADTDDRIDEIKMCYGTYDGVSACDPPPAAAQIFSDAAIVEGFYPDLFDIQPQSLPEGASGEAYPGAQFVALNGNPPHTWAVSGGALPDGLSLSSGGALTGTPAMGEGGTHNFTVRATDADGGLAYRDFSVVVQSDPDPVQQLWERDFTTLRTHYVSPTGTGNGSIGTPESFATARGHCQAGDLHIMRAGTYVGNFETACDGTSANPIIWKGFIDSNGDPENAHIDGTWWFTGDWQWVWAMHCGDSNFSSANLDCLSVRATGVSIINSVCQHHFDRSCIGGWNFGSGQVYYGNILHDTQRGADTSPPHNIYTQNVYSQNGWKYFVRNISTDTTHPSSNQVFNAGWGSTSGCRGCGFHLEDNAMQNGRLYHGQHSGGPAQFTIGDPPIAQVIYKNNWFGGMNTNVRWHFGDNTPATGRFTNNLWHDSYIWMDAHWGAESAAGCFAYPDITQFQNNRIYDPAGGGSGVYLELRTKNFASNCNRTSEGASKFRDADIWDNNTYGRTSGTGTFILGANGNTSSGNTLAQWRTKTLAARENPGSSTAFDANSTEGGAPTSDEHECFDNFYQPNWGWCRAIDWDGNGSITLSASEVEKIVGNGKTYKVRNSRNFYGTPLKSGTYSTGAGIANITLPGDAIDGWLLVYITSQP